MTRTPNLRGLIALARRDGVDIRPTLLRVITDLFVQEPVHNASEISRYTELARHMLDTVDEPARIAVAMKLAGYPHAPRELLMKLATDVIAVAEPVLRKARFTDTDLITLFEQVGNTHRQIIAERSDLPLAIAARLGEVTRQAVAQRLSGLTPPTSLATVAPAAAAIATETPLDASRPLPWLASPPSVPITPPAPRPTMPAVTRKPPPPMPTAAELAAARIELEQAALQRRPEDFVDKLVTTFELARDKAEEVVRNPSGEPVAVVCKALDMSSDAFSRIMLFLNPTIGRSVALVFSLAEFYGRLSIDEARDVVRSWRDVHPPSRRHVPATAPDGIGRHGFEPRRAGVAPLPAAARLAGQR